MKEQMLEQFSFPKKLEEELVGLILYKGMDAKVVTAQYGLPNVQVLTNWVNLYKKKLEAGTITLEPMNIKTIPNIKTCKVKPVRYHFVRFFRARQPKPSRFCPKRTQVAPRVENSNLLLQDLLDLSPFLGFSG